MTPETLGLAMGNLFIVSVLGACGYLGHRIGVAERAAHQKRQWNQASEHAKTVRTPTRQSSRPSAPVDAAAPTRAAPSRSTSTAPAAAAQPVHRRSFIHDDLEQSRRVREFVRYWCLLSGYEGDPRDHVEYAPGVDKVLLLLEAREQAVIILRFGLLDGRVRSWKEVGENLAMAPAAAQYIEAKALLKIDAFHEHASAMGPSRLNWSEKELFWYDWTTINRWGRLPVPETRIVYTPVLKKEAVQRSRAWIMFCRTVAEWPRWRRWRSSTIESLLRTAARPLPAPRSSASKTPTLPPPALPRDETVPFIASDGSIRRDGKAGKPRCSIEAVETALKVEALLAKLDRDERRVIIFTFGIGQTGSFTTDEVAALMGIDVLKAKQIELAALAKLRRLTRDEIEGPISSRRSDYYPPKAQHHQGEEKDAL
jgi:DNA-directed RNA polymerase specialized sigma24 family protein